MDKDYEAHYHRVEALHWWFQSRRQMVRELVERAVPDMRARILDVGCSSGLLMVDLKARGYLDVCGIDASQEGVDACVRVGLSAQVMDARRPDFPTESFDLITASDVLEHLDRDSMVLANWRRLLKPGGWLIVFVPAFMWLWTGHDEVNRHYRRYTRPQLTRRLRDAGFEIERSSYWNSALFVPVAMIRLVRRFRASSRASVTNKASDMFLPPRTINRGLRMWMSFENHLLGIGLNLPVGISVLTVGRNPAV